MGGSLSWRTSNGSRALSGRAGNVGALGGLVAAVVTGVVLVIGAVLTVIFAATLALVMALATALLGLSALVWRLHRRRTLQPVRIEQGHAGRSWVAYNWDRR